MKSNSEENLHENKMTEHACLVKQAEEFESKLREENLNVYRELRLQNFKVIAKKELSKNN